MTRVVAALALAGISFVASAAEKPLPVTVENTAAKPVPTTEAVARTPVLASIDGYLSNYVVPDGQVVVLQTISIRQSCPTIAPNVVGLAVETDDNNVFSFSFPLTFGFTNAPTVHVYAVTQQVSLYLAPGTTVGFAAPGGGNCIGGTPRVTLAGYAVPAASASLGP